MAIVAYALNLANYFLFASLFPRGKREHTGNIPGTQREQKCDFACHMCDFTRHFISYIRNLNSYRPMRINNNILQLVAINGIILRLMKIGDKMQQRWASVKQIPILYPGVFTESSVRWLIFNEKQNGFSDCVRRIGKKVLIDLDAFEKYIDASR